MAKHILSITVEQMADENPDTSYLEQDEFKNRLAEYRRGDFGYIGIHAKAEVQFSDGGAIQVLTSGGLWGIESDSSSEYLKEIEAEELADLRGTLIEAGFLSEYVDQVIQEQA
jgi:hypothetical protein